MRANVKGIVRVFTIKYIGCISYSKIIMTRTTTMTIRLSGALSDFVSTIVSETGSYENASEYVRDLIRRDKERVERGAFERLRVELQHAFAASDSSFHSLSASDVIARNR